MGLLAHEAAIHRPGVPFEVVSNPEFLAAGTAINDLLYPSKIIVGIATTKTERRAAETFATIYASWVPRDRTLTRNTWSSELAKALLVRCLRTTSLASIRYLLSARELAPTLTRSRAVGLDPRNRTKFLVAGIGFGGSCFEKDVICLTHLVDAMGIPDVICILGYAFKKNTSDTRETLALEIVKTLLREDLREVTVFDPCRNPLVLKNEMRSLLGAGVDHAIAAHSNAYDACDGAMVVITATACDKFSNKSRPNRNSPCL
ncbi:hypothetical protein PWT90_08058 [Aphanocladium album]|nr:hypothetical protein PWT90_08058 [Aphanocladium album]